MLRLPREQKIAPSRVRSYFPSWCRGRSIYTFCIIHDVTSSAGAGNRSSVNRGTDFHKQAPDRVRVGPRSSWHSVKRGLFTWQFYGENICLSLCFFVVSGWRQRRTISTNFGKSVWCIRVRKYCGHPSSSRFDVPIWVSIKACGDLVDVLIRAWSISRQYSFPECIVVGLRCQFGWRSSPFSFSLEQPHNTPFSRMRRCQLKGLLLYSTPLLFRLPRTLGLSRCHWIVNEWCGWADSLFVWLLVFRRYDVDGEMFLLLYFFMFLKGGAIWMVAFVYALFGHWLTIISTF